MSGSELAGKLQISSLDKNDCAAFLYHKGLNNKEKLAPTMAGYGKAREDGQIRRMDFYLNKEDMEKDQHCVGSLSLDPEGCLFTVRDRDSQDITQHWIMKKIADAPVLTEDEEAEEKQATEKFDKIMEELVTNSPD